ncbi:MAG: hypothetical protein NWF04_04260 [Candidatus Bathyarchaeota archaeon]|nr:hypothetical protein [Candidatus Bathyarchaeota archaeon]
MTAPIKRLWKNDYFQTVTVILLIVGIVFGFWYGSQLALNTDIPPALAVVSGSMCIPYGGACDGWTHPFDHTLHIGDLIIIQGVDPKDLKVDYPDSDVIVFQRPDRPENDPYAKIVHRITESVEVNGTLYFYTKGDGNPRYSWPVVSDPAYYDNWRSSPTDSTSTYNGAVSEDYIYGKVILRIPWVGHLAIFARSFFGLNNLVIVVPVIILLIILLVIAEFVLPLMRSRKAGVDERNTVSSES